MTAPTPDSILKVIEEERHMARLVGADSRRLTWRAYIPAHRFDEVRRDVCDLPVVDLRTDGVLRWRGIEVYPTDNGDSALVLTRVDGTAFYVKVMTLPPPR